jgi:hypothetical protein
VTGYLLLVPQGGRHSFVPLWRGRTVQPRAAEIAAVA